MLDPDSRFIVNVPAVAAKVIDDEAIIMNLSTGMYYSTAGAGAAVWEWMERGHSVAEIVSGLVGRYSAPASQIQADVTMLMDRLLQEGLVQESSANGMEPGAPATLGAAKLAYQPPELIRYEDMAELLALDPPMPIPAVPGNTNEIG